MNNLNGWAMSEYLPYGGFKWLKNVNEFDVMTICEKSPIGYFSKLKKIEGKECNATKGVSIATEFNKFKYVLFNEKIIRHKMKRIQSKKHKLGIYEIIKISLSCFDDKRYVLDDGIRTLAYFYKDSTTSCKEIKTDYGKKDCDKKIYFCLL